MFASSAARSVLLRRCAVARAAAVSSAGAARTMASVGDSIPSNIEMHMGFPPEKHNLADFCKDKSVILLGLPGAFTPTCSNKQIPNYLEKQDELRKAGVDSVIVYAVNDAAVMQAWAKDQNTGESMVQLMGDPAGDLTRALEMELKHPGPESKGLFGRCKRNAVYVDKGVIKAVRVSEGPDDPAGDDNPSATMADAMIPIVAGLK